MYAEDLAAAVGVPVDPVAADVAVLDTKLAERVLAVGEAAELAGVETALATEYRRSVWQSVRGRYRAEVP